MATTHYTLNDFFVREYLAAFFDSNTPVERWLTVNIKPCDIEDYPNAKVAAEIKNSPLYKALK